MKEEDLLCVLALNRVKGIGDIHAKKLISMYGSARAVFRDRGSLLKKAGGIPAAVVREIRRPGHLIRAERELRYLRDHAIRYSYFLDEDYPERMKHCIDGPILFFYKGKACWKREHVISVVGTRNMTPYGRDVCRKIIAEIAGFKPLIVSGFAYGVDICAHRAALAHGLPTLAVQAHGFDRCYPDTHRKYREAVLQQGAFLTEFWSGDPLLPQNFIRRNRIVAGMSEATVVVESGLKGGALTTADMADSYHRDVFAVPGRLTDLNSMGCNALIQQQKAIPLLSGRDLIEHLGWKAQEERLRPIQKELFVSLDGEQRLLYDYLLERGKQLPESLALHCGLPVKKVTAQLLFMEMKGLVRPLPGKWFEVI